MTKTLDTDLFDALTVDVDEEKEKKEEEFT